MNPKLGDTLIGKTGKYRLLSVLSQPNHGISYTAQQLNDDGTLAPRTFFVKTVNAEEKEKETYVNQVLRLKQLGAAFDAEMIHAERLREVPNIAHILDDGIRKVRVQSLEVSVPFLVQEYIKGVPLEDYLAGFSGGTFTGMDSAEAWLQLAIRLLKIIDEIHTLQVVHGDIWQANVLMKGDQPILVDFGESAIRDLEIYFSRRTYRDYRFLAPERREDSDLPWEAPADVYSVGMLLFYCATGQTKFFHENRQESTESVRRSIVDWLGQHNNSLYNQNRCIVHIIAQCLYSGPHDRSNAFDLLQLAKTFLDAQTGRALTMPTEIFSRLKTLDNDLSKEVGLRDGEGADALMVGSQADPLLFRLYDYSLASFVNRSRQLIHYNHFEVSGDRNEMINFIMEFLSILTQSDFYWTITTVSFWNADNLGNRGRFFDMNLLLCKRGVSVKRIFICTEDEMQKEETRTIIEGQRDMITELDLNKRTVDARGVNDPGCFTGVYGKATLQQQRELTNDGYFVGLSRAGGKYYALSFKSESSGKIVRKLCVNIPPQDKIKRHLDHYASLAENRDCVPILPRSRSRK